MGNLVFILEKGNGYLLRSLTILTALILHSALICALIIIPLIGEQELPQLIKVEPVIILPPAPPAGQLLGGGSKGDKKDVPKPKENSFLSPIPDKIVEGENNDFEKEGVPGIGVPWGSPEGVPGGVPWGIPNGVVPKFELKKIEPSEDLKPVFVHKPPKLLKKVEPVYPEIAIKSFIQGSVVLSATTDINGRVIEIKVIKSDHPILEKSAIDAVTQWIYEPYIVNGKPRPVLFMVTIKFMLRR